VAGPRIGVKRVDRNGEARPHWVQVDVADELEKIRLIFDQNVLEAPLKEMSGSAMN
jgi:hypothetical protein